ncbi:transcriptional antiterminator, BglG [Treponema primitia ZAS-2]|uniref:Transcriptional antiterminator, BglG n=1 Tax=Treponema primitia (strain ATCC BAA-887 / DSM 12427 / ZAS-2) TaxID=545694 RepID=F5YNM5_TREPZ|nr:PRD domain-containing protein [Treponema primitia]AEF86932.1 transcriptional antiterminator, BglG [Treponema primitia ZAS-2]
MKAIRKYNNNIILANDQGHEVIVLGKGIGFQANPGDPVDTRLIEKTFIPQETVQISRFADTLADLPYEYILLATKVVDCGKELLQAELNPSVVIALADHFSGTLPHFAERKTLESPLKWDLRHLYPREFKASMRGLEIIRQERHEDYPEYEAYNIALHFINAETDTADMPTTFKIVAITSDIIGIIKESLHINFDEESFDVMPFVIHLRNLVLKYTVNPEQKIRGDDDLYALVMKRYPEAADCCTRICAYLRETHGWEPVRNDRLFLVLHIKRISDGMAK